MLKLLKGIYFVAYKRNVATKDESKDKTFIYHLYNVTL